MDEWKLIGLHKPKKEILCEDENYNIVRRFSSASDISHSVSACTGACAGDDGKAEHTESVVVTTWPDRGFRPSDHSFDLSRAGIFQQTIV